MAAVILDVLDHKVVSVNGEAYDNYKLKLKDGSHVYTTTGIRKAFLLVLEQGEIVQNMRAIGKLSDEEFAKEWYEAKAIEEQDKRDIVDQGTRIDSQVKVKVIDMKSRVKKIIAPAIEQLSLF